MALRPRQGSVACDVRPGHVKGRAQHALVRRGHPVLRLLADDNEVARGHIALIHQPLRAQPTADLFIGSADDDEPSLEPVDLRAQRSRGQQHGRQRRLVVDAAQPIDATIGYCAGKGIDAPVGILAERHRVDVGVVEQRRRFLLARGYRRHSRRGHRAPPVSSESRQHAGNAAQKVGDRPAIARRVGRRNTDQLLEQRDQVVGWQDSLWNQVVDGLLDHAEEAAPLALDHRRPRTQSEDDTVTSAQSTRPGRRRTDCR